MADYEDDSADSDSDDTFVYPMRVRDLTCHCIGLVGILDGPYLFAAHLLDKKSVAQRRVVMQALNSDPSSLIPLSAPPRVLQIVAAPCAADNLNIVRHTVVRDLGGGRYIVQSPDWARRSEIHMSLMREVPQQIQHIPTFCLWLRLHGVNFVPCKHKARQWFEELVQPGPIDMVVVRNPTDLRPEEVDTMEIISCDLYLQEDQRCINQMMLECREKWLSSMAYVHSEMPPDAPIFARIMPPPRGADALPKWALYIVLEVHRAAREKMMVEVAKWCEGQLPPLFRKGFYAPYETPIFAKVEGKWHRCAFMDVTEDEQMGIVQSVDEGWRMFVPPEDTRDPAQHLVVGIPAQAVLCRRSGVNLQGLSRVRVGPDKRLMLLEELATLPSGEILVKLTNVAEKMEEDEEEEEVEQEEEMEQEEEEEEQEISTMQQIAQHRLMAPLSLDMTAPAVSFPTPLPRSASSFPAPHSTSDSSPSALIFPAAFTLISPLLLSPVSSAALVPALSPLPTLPAPTVPPSSTQASGRALPWGAGPLSRSAPPGYDTIVRREAFGEPEAVEEEPTTGRPELLTSADIAIISLMCEKSPNIADDSNTIGSCQSFVPSAPRNVKKIWPGLSVKAFLVRLKSLEDMQVRLESGEELSVSLRGVSLRRRRWMPEDLEQLEKRLAGDFLWVDVVALETWTSPRLSVVLWKDSTCINTELGAPRVSLGPVEQLPPNRDKLRDREVIVSAFTSPGNFYLQLASTSKELLKMEETAGHCLEWRHPPESLKVGELVLVPAKPSRLVRAQVMSITPESRVRLFLLDSGNTDECDLLDVLPMPENMLRWPAYAMPCQLARVLPPRGTTEWPQHCPQTSSLFLEPCSFLVPLVFLQDDVFHVGLQPISGTPEDFLANVLVRKGLAEATARDVPHSGEATAPVTIKVCVTSFEPPCTLWYQTDDLKRRLDVLKERMKLAARKMRDLPPGHPVPGRVYGMLLPDSEGGYWCRVTLLSHNRARFIDFGDHGEVGELKLLPEDFEKAPPLVSKGRLRSAPQDEESAQQLWAILAYEDRNTNYQLEEVGGEDVVLYKNGKNVLRLLEEQNRNKSEERPCPVRHVRGQEEQLEDSRSRQRRASREYQEQEGYSPRVQKRSYEDQENVFRSAQRDWEGETARRRSPSPQGEIAVNWNVWPGSKMTVLVVAMETPHELYVRPKEAQQTLKSLQTRIQRAAETAPVLIDLRKGALCLAYSEEDDTWYRAKIVSVSNERAEVHLLDHGEVLEVRLRDELVALPRSLKELPPLVLCVSLRGTTPGGTRKDWSRTEIRTCYEAVFNKKLDMEVVALEGTVGQKLSVVLRDGSVCINTQFGGSTQSMREAELPRNDRKLKNHDVRMAAYYSPANFYVVLSFMEDKLEYIRGMASAMEWSYGPPSSVNMGWLDRLVLLRHDNNRVERAQVTRVLKNGEVQLLLVDSGVTVTVGLEELLPMPDSLRNEPAFAVRCVLNGVKPPEGYKTWSSNCSAVEKAMREHYKFRATRVFRAKYLPAYFVTLEIESGGKSINLADRLAELGLAMRYLQSFDLLKHKEEETAKVAVSLPAPTPTPAPGRVLARMSRFEPPRTIWFHSTDNQRRLDEMLQRLEREWPSLTDVEAKVGLECVVKLKLKDPFFCRVRVDDLSSLEPNGPDVFMPDYGDWCSLGDELKELPDDLKSLPPLVQRSVLRGVTAEDEGGEGGIMHRLSEILAPPDYNTQFEITLPDQGGETQVFLEGRDVLELAREGGETPEQGACDKQSTDVKKWTTDMMSDSADETGPPAVTIPELPLAQLSMLRRVSVWPGMELWGRVCGVESPLEMYFRPRDGDEALKSLKSKLEVMATSLPALSDVTKATLCLAYSAENDIWYRAKVVRVLEETGVRVRLLDYGTVLTVHTEELRCLPASVLQELPAQAMRLKLRGAVPRDAAWSPEEVGELQAAVKDKILRVQLVALEGLVGQLLSAVLWDGNTCVNSQFGATTESLKPTEMACKEWRIRSRTICRLVNYTSPAKFYIVLDELTSDLFDMEKEALHLDWEHGRVPLEALKQCLAPGALVMVPRSNRPLRQRARVVSVVGDNSVTVFMLDSGHTMNVPIVNLLPMPESLRHIPAYAISCQLASVLPPQGAKQWSLDSRRLAEVFELRPYCIISASRQEKNDPVEFTVRITPDLKYSGGQRRQSKSPLELTIQLLERGLADRKRNGKREPPRRARNLGTSTSAVVCSKCSSCGAACDPVSGQQLTPTSEDPPCGAAYNEISSTVASPPEPQQPQGDSEEGSSDEEQESGEDSGSEEEEGTSAGEQDALESSGEEI